MSETAPAGSVLRVALTGGIATGKSACLRRFAELGAPTLDADQIARDVVLPGTPGLRAIAERFGTRVLRPDGTLDRGLLGRIVFADAAARRDLEAIVHPGVYDTIQRWFEALERSHPPTRASTRPAGLVDIPLLFESGREGDFDRVVVAACRPDQQVARLMARDRLDEEAARARLAAQWPLDQKVARADYVIDTSGTLADTQAGVDRVWAALST